MQARTPCHRHRTLPSIASLAMTVALLALSLAALGLLAGSNLPASAAPAAELHVCLSGCAYSTVQAAVDAANTGDLIKVAAGTYTGVESRPAPPGYLSGPANIEQAVYLNKTLTIEGGYTTSDWTVPDPKANPTILDAQGQGRVLFVFGEVSPTIAGLRLAGGDASGLGGHPWAGGSNTGGAVNVLTATATIRDCWVYESSADFGGGIYLDRSNSTVQNTEVTTNTANWGGGLSLRMSGAQILDNTIAGNIVVASGSGVPSAGAGMDVSNERALIPPILIQGNTVTGNQADHQGGGLSLRGDTDATLNANLISANTAITGGGVYLLENYVELTGNIISANTAEHGGGVAIDEGAVILEGNTLVDNTATGDGGGAFIQFEHYQGVGPTLTGNTFEGNQAASGGGLATRNADVLIRDNTFSDNHAGGGGGLDLFGSSDTLVANNLVSGNTAGSGAGIGVGMFDGTLEGNRIVSNVASGDGGGIVVFGGGTWANNVIAANQAGGRGSALFMKQGQLELRHTTIARNTNTGADDSAVYLTDESPIGGQSEATLINTILVDHSTGIRVTAGNAAAVDAVLWYNTPMTVDAKPGASVSLQNEYTGDPAFDADGYHLTPSSAALDKGDDAGVDIDIDGEPRPMLAGYDLGADEVTGAHLSAALSASPQSANPGGEVVYTAVITSDGAENATGVELTLALDSNQRALGVSASQGSCSIEDAGWGGSAACTLGTLSAGAEVLMEVTAEVATDVTLGEEMASTLTAAANEMASDAQATVVAQDCHVRLNEDATPYLSVQAAVDAAVPGDRIKVAGICLGVHLRGTLFEQVYLDRELTLQGGYTTTNWTTPDPEANPTTLDALGLGRVIYVSSGVSVTLEGLHLTDGNAAGQGGGQQGHDAGGGLYAHAATLTLRHSQVSGSTAVRGGGLYLWEGVATLTGSRISANSSSSAGGGLMLRDIQATLQDNTIADNWGGIGGGLCLLVGEGTLSGNLITGNSAGADGGMVFIASEASLTNNVVIDNYTESGPSGIGLTGGSYRLAHTTVARNWGGEESAITVSESATGGRTTVVLTNTILASQPVGLRVTGIHTVTLDGVLWHDAPTTVDADPGATVSIQNGFAGDPAFDADGYHLTIRSAAIDKGIDAGVDVDIDGEGRPRGATYDLGADETDPVADLSVTKRDDPDPVMVGQPLTYTIVVTNGGPAGATGVLLTDTLPYNADHISASPGCVHIAGVLTCDVGPLGAGSAATFTLVVSPATPGQAINLAEVAAAEPDPDPANNLQAEHTEVAPEPPPGPVVSGVAPNSGVNNTVTPIAIQGSNFQDGASVSLGAESLGQATFVNDGRLLSSVPNSLAPGTRDLTVTNPDGQSGTLASAFTVMSPGPPSLTSVSPTRGPNDSPITLDILGANFAPELTASLRLDGDDVPLWDLVFMDSTRLRAVVPVSTAMGLYELVVINPDSQSAALPEAYQALEPAASNDLYALPTDLWLDPPSIHARESLTIGLTLRRQGGLADLHDVDVRFYLEGDEPAFTGTAPVLSPNSAVTVTAEWQPTTEGEYTLYAQIDPQQEVPENDEGNNLIGGAVTVLPPLPDTTPPTVDSFAINNAGVLYTENPNVRLNTVASDEPGGSGVAYLLFVEFYFDQSKNGWEPVQQSAWLPYDQARSNYPWRLLARAGVHYIQVWAADGAGNISPLPGTQMINLYTRYFRSIYYYQTHVYRQPMEAGQSLRLYASVGYYDYSSVCVWLWAPDDSLAWTRCLYRGSGSGILLRDMKEGIYQIEVRGYHYPRSSYKLEIIPFAGSTARAADPAVASAANEQPVVPPGSVPSRHIGLPSLPSTKQNVYLPLVLKSYGP